ncbi:MAG: secretin N-terminal domain-containing protein [Candidatus Omnitrophota bacterium]
MKKNNRFLRDRFFLFFLLCVGLSFPVIAAENTAEETPAANLSAFPVEEEVMPDFVPVAPAPKAERTAEGAYYLDFKGASLINVLNILSNLSGISFIAGMEVSDRKVSMTLDNVALEDVLQALDYGCNVSYDFIPGRNIYLFRAKSDAPDKPTLLTRVFKLYYIRVTALLEIDGGSSGGSGGTGGLQTLGAPTAANTESSSSLLKAVEKILSDRGKVSVDDRSNSLIVTDSEDRLKMIESAITQLDRPLEQVLINVILVETKDDLTRDLGIKWNATGTLTGAIQETQWPFRTSAPLTSGTKDFLGNIGNTLKDTAKQFNPTIASGAIPDDGIGTRDFSGFTVTIQALEAAGRVKVLAKPKILALDNQPALIKISTQQAIGSALTTNNTGVGDTNSTERYEVGTILRVTPLINTGGRITLTLEPSFATVALSAIQVSTTGQTGDPTTRTARTTLMVNDGQTIALGGMLFSNQANTDQKVPFFGNIPVIGKALFTWNEKTIKDQELVLFVTPYIISDPSMLEEPKPPAHKLDFDKEMAPFWKVKDKQWYKEIKDGPEPKTDFEGFFNVRKKLIDSTLSNLDQGANISGSTQS